MAAVISFLIVLAASLLVIHVGAVALSMTGLSREVSDFQALSAFSRAGFTTQEAAEVVSTPVRRTIISWLIRIGSLGVVTALSSLLFSLLHVTDWYSFQTLLLLGGPLLLIGLSRSQAFDRWLTRIVKKILYRHTTLELYDYDHLLHLRDGYSIVQIALNEDSPLVRQSLGQLTLPRQGILIIGLIDSDGSYTGVPTPDTQLRAGQQVILYGHQQQLQQLASTKNNP